LFSYGLWAAATAAIFMINGVLVTGRFSVGMGILGAILGWVVSYIFMLPLDPWLVESIFAILIFWAISFFASALFARSEAETLGLAIIAYAVVFFGFLIVAFVSTHGMINAEKYANLVKPVVASRDAAMPLTDQTQVRLVTSAMARKRAAELISSSDEQGVGSRVTIGDMWGNEINGKFFWVAPLEHSSFFRYMNFGTTPGYIMVSQANELDTKFVQNHPIKIGEGAFFNDSVGRRVYSAGYINYRYDEPIFQIDPEGVPYWIVPLMYPTVGFSAYQPVKWVVINATTGDLKEYSKPEDVPAWIDRVYPQEKVAERFDDWGCYSQGWWACAISGNNVIQSTKGISVTIDPNGKIVYYSGTQFQNAKSEGASSGVYIADARTGDITFYQRAGITEETAREVLTQAYSNYRGYEAAEPILISINGSEAYFSIVVDGSGVRKGFAIVAQDNRNIVGIGSSVQAAVTEYSRALQRSSRDSAFEAKHDAESEAIEGLVVTHMPYVQNGKTNFYVSIDTVPNKIFEITEEKIGDIVVTKVGDPVRMEIENINPGVVFVTKFKNLRVNIAEEGVQSIVDNENSEVMKRYKMDKERQRLKGITDGLTSEELDRMIEVIFEERSRWKTGGQQN